LGLIVAAHPSPGVQSVALQPPLVCKILYVAILTFLTPLSYLIYQGRVRPTHHSGDRTVPEWCVGRTLLKPLVQLFGRPLAGGRRGCLLNIHHSSKIMFYGLFKNLQNERLGTTIEL
jgi:hypothetical protein